ncbi:MAG TPA: hypothetical protein DCS29_00405 [Candidatus Magasanikbacteria bacterium]|nr:MAG: hypothetical protein A2479_03630 [Candidatus Magasanikbacteria bacterium RIFOXYC2_FULL_39_8]HAT03226.1 hypothetical protein [Candidatus Magasanikbacteria bacterium]
MIYDDYFRPVLRDNTGNFLGLVDTYTQAGLSREDADRLASLDMTHETVGLSPREIEVHESLKRKLYDLRRQKDT